MPYILSRRNLLRLAAAPAALALAQDRSSSRKWALLSDVHIPTDPSEAYRGFRPVENLKKTVPAVEAFKPDGMIICGDLARLEGLPGDYEALGALVRPVAEQTPVAMALGNHDDRKNFLAAFSSRPGEAQSVQGKWVSVLDAGPVRIVLLDSLLYVNRVAGLLGKAQRQWLETYLRSNQAPTVFFVHHTLDDTDGAMLDSQRFFEIIRPAKQVKAVFYGHSHRYRYDEDDGLHLVNLPAVGYNFNDAEPVGWVEALFRKDGGDFTLRAIAGNTEQSGKTVSLRWRSS